eukprot:TRINITY_DN21113_c0_g1_i1.p1 TRINITY_DN21113_c0_g1~~TRINITY_DN21113_c0_g1_i1.p1  ORF type:complete len:450 (+),score=82.23 TRINITY_DN21113_c0_g1_i1:99-1448(+)
MKPRPKQRSALQSGPRPLPLVGSEDPSAPMGQANYHRAVVGKSMGAMPCEAYQYDIVYNAFCCDEDFWRNWKVVDCCRNSIEDSVSEAAASIHVVLDLPPSQKLFPTAYTPGFPTLPVNSVNKVPPQPKVIPGLTPGYSVALDVHILQDARVMLEFQRSFRKGVIDPKCKWLDDIVSKAKRRWTDGEFYTRIEFVDKIRESREAALATQKGENESLHPPLTDKDYADAWAAAEIWPVASLFSKPKDDNSEVIPHFSTHNRALREHPEACLRPPVGFGTLALPEGRDEVLLSAKLKGFSERYPSSKMSSSKLASTATALAVRAGDTVIQVMNLRGFDIGDTIVIGGADEPHEETRKLIALNLMVNRPLLHAYPAGTTVEVVSKARQHVYEENTLISAFSTEKTLSQLAGFARPAGKPAAQKQRDLDEAAKLERDLARILARDDDQHAHDK